MYGKQKIDINSCLPRRRQFIVIHAPVFALQLALEDVLAYRMVCHS